MTATTLIVERVVNGARNVRYEERLPENTVFVQQEGDEDGNPHIHLVFGTEEELKGIGVDVPKKRKSPAKRKSAAKRSTAKSTAKKS